MASYTAITAKRFRSEGGSLAKKLAAEFGLIQTQVTPFLSAEVTSTAAAQATAHGLGASPSVFFAILQATAASASPAMSATADATSVWVTAASTDVKYLVIAWL